MHASQYLLNFAALVCPLYLLALLYCKLTAGKCRSKRNLSGLTVIVTGSTAGIGLETARGLASRNARVILACRNFARGEKARKDIIATTRNNNVIVKLVDVSSFQSVRDFADDILKTERRLDVLVNNAGISLPAQDFNDEGHDLVMATNHLGPFLLTNLLLPLLKKSVPARIVMVSSSAHEVGRIDFDNMNGEIFYSQFKFYSTSKLANVLFCVEMATRLEGSGVTINVLHPGLVDTDIYNNTPLVLRVFVSTLIRPFQKSSKEGAETSIHVAVSEELDGVNGRYFSDCREKSLYPRAKNPNTASKLWDYSARVTNLN